MSNDWRIEKAQVMLFKTTVEEDFQTFKTLAERVPETVGHIQLEYGQFIEDFASCNGYRVIQIHKS